VASTKREQWEQEILAQHRWGRYGDKAQHEHERLKRLYDEARPLDSSCHAIIDQIVALELCNWRLEDSILAICAAIGAKKPADMKIGHMASMTDERWKKIWAYYLTCLHWLSDQTRRGYEMMLAFCDPDTVIQTHIRSMLGEVTELKQLYVQRFCLYYDFMMTGRFSQNAGPAIVHASAVSAIEHEIKDHDPGSDILRGFAFDPQYNTYAGLEFCHHKLFRRLDIILSSIGAGRWRGVMPVKGTDGFERAAVVEKYLSAIETWVKSRSIIERQVADDFDRSIHALLAEKDATKIFLASLLVSLLRSQQLRARELAKN
jgi:hypothetical protein